MLGAYRRRAGEPLRSSARSGRRRPGCRAPRPPARGTQLHGDLALRGRAPRTGAALARPRSRAARAPAARRARRNADAGRVPHLAELAGPARSDSCHGNLRRPAGARDARRARCLGCLFGRARRPARPFAVRPAARSVRNHPSLRRRQRPPRPPAHYSLSDRPQAPHPPPAVPLRLPRGAPRRVLSAPAAGAHARRVGALAALLSQRCAPHGRTRHQAGARPRLTPRPVPLRAQGTRARARRRVVSHALSHRPPGRAHPGSYQPHGATGGPRDAGQRPARGVRREALAAGLPGATGARGGPASARGPAAPGARHRPRRCAQIGSRPAAGTDEARRPGDGRSHGDRRRGARTGRVAAPYRRTRRTALLHRPRVHGPRVLRHRRGRPLGTDARTCTRSSPASATPRTATSPRPPTPSSSSSSRSRRWSRRASMRATRSKKRRSSTTSTSSST